MSAVTRYLFYFLKAQKIWHWPRKSKVLIYDACNSHLLLPYLKDWSTEVLHVRGEVINVPVFILSFFMPGKKSDAYRDLYIRKVKPSLIITFIDNNKSFYQLRKRHPELKTMFIQNGIRGMLDEIFDPKLTLPRDKLRVDYMLTFGELVGREYLKHLKGTNIPMGSLKSNPIAIRPTTLSGVMAFVSQWSKSDFMMAGKKYTQDSFFKRIDRPILECLRDYAHKNGKSLQIIPRFSADHALRPEEESYYRELLKQEPVFLAPTGENSSYAAIDAAEVVVTVESKLGYEALARGKKTAIFSIRSKILGVPGRTFGWPGNFPDEGPFWTNNPDPNSFIRIMDYLFSVDKEVWQQELERQNYSAIMLYDRENSILKALLRKELGEV